METAKRESSLTSTNEESRCANWLNGAGVPGWRAHRDKGSSPTVLVTGTGATVLFPTQMSLLSCRRSHCRPPWTRPDRLDMPDAG